MPPSASPSGQLSPQLSDSEASQSALTDFYNGANIFLTGATGFMGKLVLEKLLRSCPDVGTLYVLIRAKKGQDPQQRASALFDDPLFARLKEQQPRFRQHVVAVAGDCSLPGLGLSETDRSSIVSNVHVIIHGAATVRFDENLKTAVCINVKGTFSVLELAKESRNLKVVMHVSTAYSNCNRTEIKESLYDVPLDADKVMQIMDAATPDIVDKITPMMIGTWPNSYAYTKALGENVVKLHAGNLPIGIFRPSIVISTAKEPVAGWIDNLYGPTGVVLGAGLGLLHCLQADDDVIANMVPVDMAVNSLLAAAWDTASMSSEERISSGGIPVYNYVSSVENPVTWKEFMDKTISAGEAMPSSRAVWQTSLILVKYRWAFLLLTAVLHFLPALLVDAVCIIINNPFRLLTAYKKIYKFSNVIAYFSTRNWDFNNDRVQSLWQRLSKRDQEIFHFNLKDLNWANYFHEYIYGCRLYMFKDDPKSIPEALDRQRRLYWLHQGVKLFFIFMVVRLCWVLLLFTASWVPSWAVPESNSVAVSVSRSKLAAALRHLGIMPTS